MNKYTSYQDVLDCGMERVVLTGPDCMVMLNPSGGMNLYSWIVRGRELMMPTHDISVGGTSYGTPLLFPTPNRIRDCTYTFKGKTNTLHKNGKDIFIHGLLKDEPFAYKHWSDDKAAYCQGSVTIAAGDDMATGYPFPCTFTVLISFCERGVKMDFTVDNNGQDEMPFGVAIHPYFTKTGDTSQVFLSCPATKRFEADDQLLPTGKLFDVKGDKDYDLSDLRPIADTNVDTVYMGMSSDKHSRIEFRDWGISMNLHADDDFTHAVVYTPPNRPGFCIEPQTCSTDFINLNERGLTKESGILTLPAGESWKGTVYMDIDLH